MNEAGIMAFEEVMDESAEKVAKEVITEVAETSTKILLKKSPFFIGLGFSIPFAIQRFKDGDIVGGMLELASGLAAAVPGYGTTAAVGIDTFAAGRDIYGAVMEPAVDKSQVSEITQAMAAGSQGVSLVAPVNVTNNYDQSQVVTESGGSQGNIGAGRTDSGYMASKSIAGRL